MKKFILVIVCFLSLGIFASCSKKSDTVVIEFMNSAVEKERQEVIDGLIKEFSAVNPNITVKQVPVDEDSYNTKVTTLGSSGKLPAVLEINQDFAKVMNVDKLIDLKAMNEVMKTIGESNFYEGAKTLFKSEDGKDYLGIPVQGWVQGVWYDIAKFKEKGLKEPKTWDDILNAAKTFNDPENKKYGIALATAEDVFTEQVFSQFALSNNANVFDANGKIIINSKEFVEATKYYQELAKYTMPGSNGVTEVKDAFMASNAPMAIYSTYITPAVYEAKTGGNLGYVVPTKQISAAYGTVTGLSIASGLDAKQKEAAQKFIAFMATPKANVKWILMSPGGAQPVIKGVSESQEYLNNEVIKAFKDINQSIVSSYDNLKIFGLVGDINFSNMGKVTSNNIISKLINQITVGNKDVDAAIKEAQSAAETAIK